MKVVIYLFLVIALKLKTSNFRVVDEHSLLGGVAVPLHFAGCMIGRSAVIYTPGYPHPHLSDWFLLSTAFKYPIQTLL